MRILSDNRRQIPFMRRQYPLSAAHVVNAPFCGHSSGLPCHGRTAAMRPAAERQRILRRRVESSDVPRHPPMWGASTKRDARRLTSPASPRNAGAFVPEEHEQKRSPAEASPCPCRDAVSGTSSNTGPATRSDSPPVQPPKYRIGPPTRRPFRRALSVCGTLISVRTSSYLCPGPFGCRH